MKQILVLILVMSLLILGCGSSNQLGPDVEDFKLGIREVTLEPDTFPEVVFQDSRLQGSFIIKNSAGYDAENINVNLLGLNRNVIDLASGIKQISYLPGRSLFLKDGGDERVTFEGTVKKLLPGKDQDHQQYLILLQYSSKVEFSPTVCVDSGLYSVGSGCNFNELDSGRKTNPEIQSFSGQGAPVAVNSLEIIPYTGTNSEIELRMKVVNRGRGFIKTLRLGRATLGSIPLNCEFKGKDVQDSGFVQFITKESTPEVDIVCKGKLESGIAYETALYIELFYDYELEIERSLEIRR